MPIFIKKDWNIGDIITEYHMDRIEQGVQDAFTAATAAETAVNTHVLDESIHVTQDILDIISESGASPGGGRILTTLDISNVYDIPHNYDAVVDPTAADDTYTAGSIWVNNSTDKAFICTDATTDAAVWKDITASGSVISGSGVTNHNDLSAIQGGTTGDYYHLTAAQSSALIAHLTDYDNPHETPTGAEGYVTLDDLGYLEREQIPPCNLRNIFDTSFISSATPADSNWRGICWSPELRLWCSVASSGTGARVMTSPDGVTWTARTAAEANAWADVIWVSELALFVAVAYGGTNRVMTSPDGITWTARSAADNSKTWTSICWSPELALLVAVAYNSGTQCVMTSSNGTSWTLQTASNEAYWEDVCWSPELNLFVAVSGASATYRVMTSSNGTSWTGRSIPTEVASNQWGGVAWSPTLGMFAAVSYTGTYKVMTSTNGITWTSRSAATTNNWYKIIWAPEFQHFVASAITGTGNRIMYSRDGINWYSGISAADESWYTIGYSTTLAQICCTAVTGTGYRVMRSPPVADFAVDSEYAKVGHFSELYVDDHPVVSSKDRIVTKSAAYTASVSDRIILCSGTWSLTLPSAESAAGVTYVVKNTGTGTITIDGSGSETIDGATTKALSTQWSTARIISNGTAWFVI